MRKRGSFRKLVRGQRQPASKGGHFTPSEATDEFADGFGSALNPDRALPTILHLGRTVATAVHSRLNAVADR